MESLVIYTDTIKLKDALKLAGIIDTGGEGREFLFTHEVLVNNESCYQRGKKLRNGDILKVEGRTIRIVGENY